MPYTCTLFVEQNYNRTRKFRVTRLRILLFIENKLIYSSVFSIIFCPIYGDSAFPTVYQTKSNSNAQNQNAKCKLYVNLMRSERKNSRQSLKRMKSSKAVLIMGNIFGVSFFSSPFSHITAKTAVSFLNRVYGHTASN